MTSGTIERNTSVAGVAVGGLTPEQAAAALTEQSDTPLLVVTSTYREAESARDTLRSLLGTDAVAYYPAWETLPHERLSPRSDTVGRRLAVLRRLPAAFP